MARLALEARAVTLLAGLASGALTIWLLWGARGVGPRPRRPKLAALLAGAALVALAAGLRVVVGLPGVPYNVRELFSGGGPEVFALALLVLAVAPAASTRHAYLAAPLALLAAILVGLSVTSESMADLAGTPSLPVPVPVEHVLRLAGLLCAPVALAALGLRRGRPEPVLVATALAGWAVVVPGAATDNVVELLRGGGYDPRAVVGLAGLGGLLGAVASGRTPRALAAIPCSVPAAWGLLVLATEPALTKYGKTFSARQFLLSPDRDHYLPDGDLWPRFAALWVAAALGLALGTLLVRLAAGPRPPMKGA